MKETTNNISKPFENIFLIMYGLILTEIIKRTVENYSSQTCSLFVLSLTVCLLILFSAFETLLDFKIVSDTIPKYKITVFLIRYFTWFIQFLPFYYAINQLFSNQDEVLLVRKVAYAFSLLYCIYFLINVFTGLLVKKQKRKEKSSNYFTYSWFYLGLSAIFICFNLLFTYLFQTNGYGLSILLVLVQGIYLAYWWDKYFKGALFPKEKTSANKSIATSGADTAQHQQ